LRDPAAKLFVRLAREPSFRGVALTISRWEYFHGETVIPVHSISGGEIFPTT